MLDSRTDGRRKPKGEHQWHCESKEQQKYAIMGPMAAFISMKHEKKISLNDLKKKPTKRQGNLSDGQFTYIPS